MSRIVSTANFSNSQVKGNSTKVTTTLNKVWKSAMPPMVMGSVHHTGLATATKI